MGRSDNPFMMKDPQHSGSRALSDRRRAGTVSLAQFGVERRAGADRRNSPRVQLEIGCECEADGSWFYRMSYDLSLTGLSLARGLPFPAGTSAKLRLLLPDGREPMDLTAEVVGRFDGNGGMRLRFLDLAGDQTFRLARALLMLAEVSRAS